MTAREQAVLDIQQELSSKGKCFLAFRTELNSIMEELVNNQIKAQEQWQGSSK
jgi:hypothetical protein